MAVMRVQANYRRGEGEKWSNVWHVIAADVIDAQVAADTVMKDFLLQLLDSSCKLVSFLVSDPAGPTFVTVNEDEVGTSTASGDLIPLFNACKVLFPSALGRPDLKYFKGFVTESIQTSGNLNSGTITAVDGIVEDLLDAMVSNGTELCSEDGTAYTVASVQSAVQMRQMHRKRKKSTP